MELLLKLGVAGATPFVLQFFMDYITNGNSSSITRRMKMTLSVITGGILAFLVQLYTMYISAGTVLMPSALGWFFIVLNGCISGAMATAAVALSFKMAEKISANEDREIIVTGSNRD